jgi:NodT family efflux transporter outer membrane factor (OMF) lipoprotein
MSKLVLLPMAALLAGCVVGPDYEAPKLGLPLGWLGMGQSEPLLGEGEALKLEWWSAFNDPILDGLMKQAVERNGDLRVAQANVLAARGARLAANAALLPEIDGVAQGARGTANSAGRLVNTSAAEFDASWEIDLFGGNRRAAQAARARLGGVVAEARLTRVRLLAEVATQYLDVRRLQQQLAYARKNLSDQQETLRLVRAQQKEGVVSNLVVAQNEAQVGSTAAAIPQLEANLSAAVNALGVLVGAQPVEIAKAVGTAQPVPVATPKVLLATPASVLAARPDIRVAERNLAAATADQGVAIANWFPKVSLTGLFGLQDYGAGADEGWSVGGVVSLPMIDFGRVRALVRQADARQQAALATYEQTVLSALADVETSMTAYAKAVERVQRLREAADASRNALRLAKLQYTEGVASNLDVIVAEQQQLTAEDALAGGEAAVGQGLAGLYKAIGGGE